MMLSEARTRLRRWLEDESASPLWTDDQLTEALTVGLAEVSDVAPGVATETRTVAEGDTSIDVPTVFQRIVRVLDPNGVPVPFDLVADELRPAGGGYWYPVDYTILYEVTLALPDADSGDVPAPARLERLMLAAAAYWALSQRATAESKRGGVTNSEHDRLEATRQDLDTLRKQARRTVRYSSLVA